MSEVGLPVGGYPTEIFKNGFDVKILCNSCNKVLRDPVQSYCGHRFCRNCISAITSSGNQVKCKSCIEEGVDNEDYSIIKKEQLFPDNALRREMFSMEANCSNPGCTWLGKFRDFEKHVKECKYQPIPCPNCGDSVEVSKMKGHVENECPKRPVTCKYCSLSTKQDQLEQHKEECPKRPIKCESCGKKKIPRDKIQEHKDSDCPNQKLPCLAGCEGVERRQFITHIEEKPGFHIQQIMEVLSRLSDDFKSEQIIRTNNNMQQNNNNNNNNRTTTVFASSDVAQSADSMEYDVTRIQTLEIKVGTFEGIVTTLHREAERILGVLDDRQIEMDGLKKENEEKAQKIRELERKLASSEVHVMQLNQRVLSSDVCSYNGELVWRIDKWSEQRAKAVAGNVTSVFSPPFYTSKYGYKMCVRIYPNGDGMGKNTHVSIFFAVLRSDYDPVLSWPFSKRVRFTVFDQTSGIHITDSFRTDPNSSSFQRPTTDMNIASGCPLFLPLTRLNGNNGFVKDDVMFIKTKVEDI